MWIALSSCRKIYFSATSIATCINGSEKISKKGNSTLFIDASREFIKVTNSKQSSPMKT
jgi:type I restriction enzyme M protein